MKYARKGKYIIFVFPDVKNGCIKIIFLSER